MSPTSAHAATAECEPTTVPLREVEREMDRQLKCIQDKGGDAPVVRSCLSNLIIYCNSEASAEAVCADVPEIVAQHPARVLLLVHDPFAVSGKVSATVHSRMHPLGRGLRAFSEQVTLRAGGRSGEHLPYAVRSLLVGDLPTNLWWVAPQPPAMAGALLYELSDDADQVLYDSMGWPEPALGMLATASWIEKFERGPGHGHHRVVSDLTWRRQKGWRRVLAEALAPAVAPGAVETTSEILVEHGPDSVMAAWGLASWLSLALGWTAEPHSATVQPGVEINWRFKSPKGPKRMTLRRLADAPQGVRKVSIQCEVQDRDEVIHLVPEDDGRRLCVDLVNDDLAPRTIAIPPQTIADLVARQLSNRERDPAFRATMAVGQILAARVLG